MVTKHKCFDSKGRIALGQQFANRMAIVDQSDPNRVVITMAKVIPEQEAWLYENEKAVESVRRGLAQAAGGEFVTGPDLDSE